MNENKYDFKLGLILIIIVNLCWGFQPVYWALCEHIDVWFLMTNRAIFACVFLVIAVKAMGYMPEMKAALRDPSVMKREFPAALFLLLDWAIYLWAVQNGRLLETVLGYSIEPVMIFLFGVIFFRERFTWKHIVILVLIAIGVVFSTTGFGELPWVVLTLACMFPIYVAIKKSLTISSIVSTTIETLIITPFGILFNIIFRSGENGFAGMDMNMLIILVGAGIVTGFPLVLYSISVVKLPLTALGISGYLSPVIGVCLSIYRGEVMTRGKILSVICFFGAAIFYTIDEIKAEKTPECAGDASVSPQDGDERL